MMRLSAILCCKKRGVTWNDGTVKLAEVQPTEAPDEGSHGGGGLRLFRRRR